MSAPVVGGELDLFRKFVEACQPILAAGFEHARDEALERHTEVMAAIADQRAIPRLVVAWDNLYVVVTVDAAGRTTEGKEVSFPIFSYRLHREPPPGAH